MKKAACLDCEKPYEDFGLDVVLTDGQWVIVHPDKHGLLCAQCIINRISKLKIAIRVDLTIVTVDVLDKKKKSRKPKEQFADMREICPRCGEEFWNVLGFSSCYDCTKLSTTTPGHSINS